jgi:hypothetical protein
MRSDMKWIIGDKRGSRVSGPRKGKRFSPAEFRRFDWDIDDAPFVGGLVGHGLEKSLIGVRRHGRGLNTKPMERYLARQVGRIWNDVLSDIHAELRRADIAEEHWPHVAISCVSDRAEVVDGQVTVKNWRGKDILLSDEGAPKFYVDPRNGRLHRNSAIVTYRMHQKRAAAAKASELASRMRALSPTVQLHLLADGNWWEVTLAGPDWTRSKEQMSVEDVVLKAGLSDLPREVLYGGGRALGISKRPLSSREIKRYGLRTANP